MNAIDLCSDLTARKSKLAVVGLGYVGLPLAVQFAKHYDVIGFDTNEKKVARYKAGVDVTGEAGDAALKETDCQFTAQEEALKDADFVYIKNWSSFNDYGKVAEGFDDWMLTEEKMKITNNGKPMHCLPVRRNVEVSDEVLDSEQSLIFEQSYNRLFAAQAVLKNIL